jgi:hypothetical protein
LYTFKAVSEGTDGKYALLELVIQPQNSTPPHIHSREAEAFFIEAAEVEFQLGDRTVIATPGTFLHAFRTVSIEGVDIFYREAGSRNNPTILLLHGFLTSSHMFRNLTPALADHFHLVAPDYPGFGYSAMPTVDEFDYTFDHLTEVMSAFIDAIGLKRYSLYLMNYGV